MNNPRRPTDGLTRDSTVVNGLVYIDGDERGDRDVNLPAYAAHAASPAGDDD